MKTKEEFGEMIRRMATEPPGAVVGDAQRFLFEVSRELPTHELRACSLSGDFHVEEVGKVCEICDCQPLALTEIKTVMDRACGHLAAAVSRLKALPSEEEVARAICCHDGKCFVEGESCHIAEANREEAQSVLELLRKRQRDALTVPARPAEKEEIEPCGRKG